MFLRRLNSRLGAGAAALTGLTASASRCLSADADAEDPVVVVGGGVIGRCVAWRLALAGSRVVLFDALNPVRGSWGETRASHLAMEDRTLLRMGLASTSEWHALEQAYSAAAAAEGVDDAAERRFYFRAGRLFAGPVGSVGPVVSAVRSEVGADEVEVLSAAEANARFPQLSLREGKEECLYMRRGNVLSVNTALDAIGWAATRAGAVLHEAEAVEAIDRQRRTVTTSEGRTLPYSRLVLASGPWTNQTLARCGLPLLPLVVSNEQTLDFGEADGWAGPGYAVGSFPLFTWSEAGYKGRAEGGGCRYFYCVPTLDADTSAAPPHARTMGFKIGYHRQGPLMETADFVLGEAGRACVGKLPHERKEVVARQCYDETDEWALAATRAFVAEKLPGLDPQKVTLQMRCLYQNTPDLGMIVGEHPADPRVVVLCGFSGSGFQFAPAIGEFVARLIAGPDRSAHVEAVAAAVEGGVAQMSEEQHADIASRFTPRRFAREMGLG